MAGKLSTHILSALDIPRTKLYLWTDSTTVIDWLAIEERSLQTFVKNRCINIKKAALQDNIRWLPGSLNPADLGTRRISTSDFLSNSTWLTGPSFLQEDESKWPIQHIPGRGPDVESELRKETIQNVSNTHPDVLDRFLAIRPWKKLVRLVARMKRLGNSSSGENLSLEELRLAELTLCAWAQATSFSAELSILRTGGSLPRSNKIFRLRPQLDTTSLYDLPLVRLYGRIHLAKHLKFDARCPLLLRGDSPYVRSLIDHYHCIVLEHNGGVNTLLSMLQKKYWLLYPIATLRRYLRSCVKCRRRDTHLASQIMAPLPDFRIPAGDRPEPFATCAVDCSGPVLITMGRGCLLYTSPSPRDRG